MSILLFKMRHVEEDEADEIRALLDAQEIPYYETNNGRWGLGYAAIWLHDETYLEQGKRLIADYQQQRYAHARANYQALVAAGKQPTWWSKIKASPIEALLVLLAMVIVAIFTLAPFLFL
jgi:flagellin-like protein